MTFLPRNNLLAALLIFCGGLLLFTVALPHQEIIGFESRFYLFALSMWRHGPTWFPTISGEPYPDYPATSTLLIYVFAKVMGHLDKWVAVFPSAVAASITLATTYLIGALQSRQWGWIAVCFLILTNTFLTEARTISPDQYIVMVTTLIFYITVSAQFYDKTDRLYFVPLLLLLGFAFRGPIGLVVPAGVWCMIYLVDNQYRKFLQAGLLAAVLLAIGCAVLYWLALHTGGNALAQDVFQQQVSGRMTVSSLPWYFYFTESVGAYALTYPLVLLMLVGLCFSLKKVKQQNFLLKLLDWGLVILIGMSIPAGKKIRYVLAFAPALSLICAWLFAQPQQQKYLRHLRNVVFWFCCFFPLLCFAATLAVEITSLKNNWQPFIYFPLVFVVFLFLQWLSLFFKRNVEAMLGVAALSFVMAFVLLLEPINLFFNATHDFVQRVEALRHEQHMQLAFYKENPDGIPIKYLLNMPVEEKILFYEFPEQLSKPVIFVASPEHFAAIPKNILQSMKVLLSGRLGHDPVIVFAH